MTITQSTPKKRRGRPPKLNKSNASNEEQTKFTNGVKPSGATFLPDKVEVGPHKMSYDELVVYWEKRGKTMKRARELASRDQKKQQKTHEV